MSISINLACSCREWKGTPETLDDLQREYRFVCPDCGEDVKLVSYSEAREIDPQMWADLAPKARS
jgi:transcription initiation factor IIE alpha subunit